MIRKYPCNREYEKIIRYNGNWFKLKSIFDNDACVSDFDFNQEIENDELFDFNKVLDLTNNATGNSNLFNLIALQQLLGIFRRMDKTQRARLTSIKSLYLS